MSTRTIAAASSELVAAIETSGTFTPTIRFGGASVGVTYATTPTGIYKRIGSLVFVKLDVILSNKGSSTGVATIGGLPVLSSGDAYCALAIGFADALASITGQLLGFVIASDFAIALNQTVSGTSASLTNSNFTNSSRIIAAGCYTV